jgi:hypothetical protein
MMTQLDRPDVNLPAAAQIRAGQLTRSGDGISARSDLVEMRERFRKFSPK